jgi:hypothetical protein
MTHAEQFKILLQKFTEAAEGVHPDVVMAAAGEVIASAIVSDSSDFDEAWDSASWASRKVLERAVMLWNEKGGKQ